MNKEFLAAIVIVSLAAGVGIGYFIGAKNNQAPNPLTSGPNTSAPSVIGGTIKKVTSSEITLDGGWTIGINSDTLIQFVSGTKIGVGDLKLGMLVSVFLDKNQQVPGNVSSKDVVKIVVTPIPGSAPDTSVNVPPPPGTPAH